MDSRRMSTVWVDTTINFHAINPRTNTINTDRSKCRVTGKGWSLWRGQLTLFVLSGKMDLNRHTAVIVKQHQGTKWCNTTRFLVKLAKDTSNNTWSMRGVFDHGTILLRQSSQRAGEF
jgi:hypothetical protein